LGDLGLTTKQKREVLDILKQGGRFGDIKEILQGFGVENVGSLKDSVKAYVDYLGIDTPYVPPKEDYSDYFDINDDVTLPDDPIVGPDPNWEDYFPATGDYDEDAPIVGPLPPTTEPTPPAPPTTEPTPTYDPFADFMSEFEFPDFAQMLEDQQAAYEQMLADAEADRIKAQEEAELRRRTELSNMAQGSRVAEFKTGITDRGRGGTSEFKRRAAPSSMLSINPMVNRSLSLGAGIMGRPRRTYR